MTSFEQYLQEERSTIRNLPAPYRLKEINRLFVHEIECLGYELAHLVETGTVQEVFITATEIETKLHRLQDAIEGQLVH